MPIDSLIEFYGIFEGIDAHLIKPDLGLKQNILNIYLKNFEHIREKFIYDQDEQGSINKALIRLARGDRKRFSIHKELSRTKANLVYKILFEKDIIKEELSQEVSYWLDGRKKRKKALRGYSVENKVNFLHESTRFWFGNILPFEEEILAKKFEFVLNNLDINKHLSLSFELLSLELLKKVLSDKKILFSGSFWTKNNELDILVKTKDGLVIVGECKYKHTKICKNILNSLKRKSEILRLNPSHFALFSKSGFSKELLSVKDENILLFSLKDFERLL